MKRLSIPEWEKEKMIWVEYRVVVKNWWNQSETIVELDTQFSNNEEGARIMSNTNKCVICEVELRNPIMLGQTAPKAWAKKNGYDGYQWREPKSKVISSLKSVKEELLEPDPHPVMFPDSVKFFTCMKHTGKEFDTVGEAAEPSEDGEDA